MIVQGKNMKDTLKRLKTFNWQLFTALCALSLIPAIYQTIKTFIISANDSGTAFDIIGQMEWFDLINETLQAWCAKWSIWLPNKAIIGLQTTLFGAGCLFPSRHFPRLYGAIAKMDIEILFNLTTTLLGWV